MENNKEEMFDTVILNGLVMDPESGLNNISHIGISAGKIMVISEDSLIGKKTIDATGLVISPGFIDLHAHGQNNESFELMVQDGVTTAFELEVGTWDVDNWYKEREDGQILNYGVSVGHIQVRMQVMGDESDFLPSGPGGNTPTTEESLLKIKEGIEKGLSQGAVGVGFGLAYTPAATSEEFEAILEVAKEKGAASFIHLRGGMDGLEEAIQGVVNTRAQLHIVHVNSSGGAITSQFIERIEQARSQGLDITTEAYPYEAGMTMLESALFDDWPSWEADRIRQLQWVETGDFLTRESLPIFREQGGAVIIHDRTEEMTLAAINTPITMIASDGFFENGKGHPRTSGTYSKVLRKYVREKKLFTLMEALRRMTIEPAKRLDSYVPAMKNKGRIKVGADADITIFDPATVTDRSTYTEPGIPSEGIEYVLINGIPVVEQDKLVPGLRPGLAVRKSDF
jgi:dihydroorotase